MRDVAACVSDEDSPATQHTVSSCRRSAQQLWLYVPLPCFFVPLGAGILPLTEKSGVTVVFLFNFCSQLSRLATIIAAFGRTTAARQPRPD
ncbi:hypothetical protein AUP74_00733 [Microbulbifer aggregans]|uniref:Uncharacterized protein n=1 Tax=Microbulbifer aggregans TaxID=1769779 RepID=A0A1C9W4W9_9GAMM|nr:hypothetical protein AUP74_00733 [Microbulbifer aggregans]